MKYSYLNIFSVIAVGLSLVACSGDDKVALKVPHSTEELGEMLFFDTILSRGNQVSCASCHKPEFAFADNNPVSTGVDGLKGDRNSPSCMNLGSRNFFFWDGRAESLEEQALGPIENPVEMDLPLSEAIRKLNKHPQYRSFFVSLYGRPADREALADALASFQRTLETNKSAFDKWMSGSDTTLMTASAKRGREIFNEKGKCFDCHFGPDFTGDQFRNIGIFNGKDLHDSGRYLVTKKIEDIGKFKTPGLRNIAITAPYMHNGMHKTLREVIDYYDTPDKFIPNPINRDPLLDQPLGLTEQEKVDLEAFLLSLTDERFLKKKETVVAEK
jgi:cytochrome c peroxidase